MHIRAFIIKIDKRSMQTDQARLGQVHEIPIDKPIQKGGYVANREGERCWVTFRYERLPIFGMKGFPFFAITVESLGMTKNTAHQVLQNNALIDNMVNG